MIVYILKSEKDNSFYVGMTSDMKIRIEYHNAGRVKSTKARVPWKVVHVEEFETRPEAREREVYLKSAAGRRFRQKILGD